jgi:hypothetical protein
MAAKTITISPEEYNVVIRALMAYESQLLDDAMTECDADFRDSLKADAKRLKHFMNRLSM